MKIIEKLILPRFHKHLRSFCKVVFTIAAYLQLVQFKDMDFQLGVARSVVRVLYMINEVMEVFIVLLL